LRCRCSAERRFWKNAAAIVIGIQASTASECLCACFDYAGEPGASISGRTWVPSTRIAAHAAP
jgi:hypothetical protein